MSGFISWQHVDRAFGDAKALNGFSLDVEEGAILCLVGPSGCGKTTALRVLAGFDQPDAGRVEIRGRAVVDGTSSVPPERRSVGMVFQDYALFPHLTVEANIRYGLGSAQRNRVGEVLELTGLEGMGNRMPHELSGGEQQRVALARALAPRPDAILLDEPFSNLDASLRDRMRREVRRILNDAGTTAVLVTHDQEEALAVADTVAIMREGAVLQVGSPTEVYERPATPWVAGFLGDSVGLDGHVSGGRVTTLLGSFLYRGPLEGPVEVMVRPEWIEPTPDESGEVVVVDREFYGHDQMLLLELPGGTRLISRVGPRPSFELGESVRVKVSEAVVFAPE
ncbi:MAG: ABC transporter ATP-binding protein [Acidimicrobiia bacterium]|nr:ABC transporter ATP-binding protein [Acidimicrobiia bacterium]